MPRLLLPAAILLSATAATAEVPQVVTDVPITQSLVAGVMGDLGTPEVIVTKGADPHDYQLRPSQARALAGAHIVFWVGPEMTPWLNGPLEASGAATRVELLEVAGTHLRHFEEAEADHDDHDHADETDHADDHGHDHSGTDPHAWLDPDNARTWLAAIAETLAGADPENAVTYRANADTAAQEIADLDASLKNRTGALTKSIVVSHDAYGYLAEHYGLAIAGSLSEGDAARPGAARVSELRQILDSGNVACVFPEAGHDPKPLAVLTDGTPAKLGAPLDPAGLDLEPGPGLYRAVLDDLIEKITACAG